MKAVPLTMFYLVFKPTVFNQIYNFEEVIRSSRKVEECITGHDPSAQSTFL
jgi:hypothetical protein